MNPKNSCDFLPFDCVVVPKAVARAVALARSSSAWDLYDAMRGGIILVVLGITAAVAYSAGRQNVPAPSAPVSAPPASAKLVAFSGPAQGPAPAATSRVTNVSTPSAKVEPSDTSVRQDNKRSVEGALTAAAIAAIIVQASRHEKW
jgi:hypothetical protein